MLANSPRGVHQARANRNDDEALILQLDRPLRRRDERSGLRHAVRRHVRDAGLAHEPRVRDRRAHDDDLLRAPHAQQRQEGGDAVDHAERVDPEL